MAMHLIRRPASFDVMVAENLFGDILTDEAAMLAGSMGMLPSASLGDVRTATLCRSVFTSRSTAARRTLPASGIANPLATILSVAMLLRHSLGLETEATAIEAAVNAVLNDGARTSDIASGDSEVVGTQVMGDLVVAKLIGNH
jgi:3-isopropylmalate dehydrogenase